MPARKAQSSGDLVADRRYEYARAYAAAGDVVAAADLYAQVLELAPDWLPALIGRADALIELGDRPAAIPLLEAAARLDPEGLFGAGLKLAAIGAATTPAAPPAAYVRGLFDDYADRFEVALVDHLGYRAPWLIADAIERQRPGASFATGLDLGCGTGLMAAALVGKVETLDGCDLSGEMVARARATGRYRQVDVADVVSALDAAAEPLDLVTAADVFVYVGDLAPVFSAVERRLAKGGLFAFSVEEAAEGGLRLRDSLRYAHGADYIEATAKRVGLHLLSLDRAVLRRDRDRDIAGLIFVLGR